MDKGNFDFKLHRKLAGTRFIDHVHYTILCLHILDSPVMMTTLTNNMFNDAGTNNLYFL